MEPDVRYCTTTDGVRIAYTVTGDGPPFVSLIDGVVSHVALEWSHPINKRMLEAEARLKAGEIRAIVATGSLELGIDVGAIECVCQVESPRVIATAIQRVGRSGHWLGATPKGRLFALTRDDLLECAALVREIRAARLDRVEVVRQPLDVLAQQVVAACADTEWEVDRLFDLVRRTAPYHDLAREDFDAVLRMEAERLPTEPKGVAPRLHWDTIRGRIRGRRGARLAVVTSGGTIPDTTDYDVVLEPEGIVLGQVNEDFAQESMRGDIFTLGNASWRIRNSASSLVKMSFVTTPRA